MSRVLSFSWQSCWRELMTLATRSIRTGHIVRDRPEFDSMRIEQNRGDGCWRIGHACQTHFYSSQFSPPPFLLSRSHSFVFTLSRSLPPNTSDTIFSARYSFTNCGRPVVSFVTLGSAPYHNPEPNLDR